MGGIDVNDRSVSLLEQQYNVEIIRTRKGRGAILCEGKQGQYILKEFVGTKEKAELQDLLLERLHSVGYVPVEQIIRNKEGELISKDQDGTAYILKTWFEGREVNINDSGECQEAVRTLAGLHTTMQLREEQVLQNIPVFSLEKEYLRHNKELKKVRRFLKEKSQKTEFELFLNHQFDYFLEQAQQILEDVTYYETQEEIEDIRNQGYLCHGDYQYHNVIVTEGDMNVINFEKCILDNQVRDLYLFMRKLLEKNNWDPQLGDELLGAYNRVKSLSARDEIALLYRFAYPEKFWKIVNFYFNSGKSWIPGKNMEKLEKLLEQEKEKQNFLSDVFQTRIFQ